MTRLTLKELANLLCVSKRTIYRWKLIGRSKEQITRWLNTNPLCVKEISVNWAMALGVIPKKFGR